MISGTVNAQLEPTITLQIRGCSGHGQQVNAVIDTGYNGALALPATIIAALALPAGGSRLVTLGDGSQSVLNLFLADVVWDGQVQRVAALSASGDPLIGTALMDGFRLEVSFADGGHVTIEPLPAASP
jgi:clan AA aspartic protease